MVVVGHLLFVPRTANVFLRNDYKIKLCDFTELLLNKSNSLKQSNKPIQETFILFNALYTDTSYEINAPDPAPDHKIPAP